MSLCSISCEYNIVSKCRSTIQVLKVFQSQNVILGSLSFVSTSRDPGSEVVIDIFASSADLFTEELGYLDLLVRKFIKPFSCISKDINCVQRKSKCINAGHEHLNYQASVETRTCNPTIALQSLRRFRKILILRCALHQEPMVGSCFHLSIRVIISRLKSLEKRKPSVQMMTLNKNEMQPLSSKG